MNLYDLLEKSIADHFYSCESCYIPYEKRNELDSDQEREIWDLICDICSIHMEIEMDGVIWGPAMTWKDKRCFPIEGIDDKSYEILSNLDNARLPTKIRAKIADLIWTQKHDYNSAVIAVQSYFDVTEGDLPEDKWFYILDAIKRVIAICCQIGDFDTKEKACQFLWNQLKKMDGKDEGFMSLRILDILVFHKYGNPDMIRSFANQIIENSKNNPGKVEQAYEVLFSCSKWIKDRETEKKDHIKLADYYIGFGVDLFETDNLNAIRADGFIKKAVEIYRNNGAPIKADEAIRKLVIIQKSIPNSMMTFSYNLDISDVCKAIDKNFEGLSFEEAIVRLAQIVFYYRKEKLKKDVQDEFIESPISSMFGKTLVGADGITKAIIPPLSEDDFLSETDVLLSHIRQKIIENANLSGDIAIRQAIRRIRERFTFDDKNLDFLVDYNAVIPDGRKRVIKMGVYHVLKGEYYEAVHILAPQVENIFRNIAREAGGLSVSLKEDGSMQEKLLNSIFDIEELKDCYDNDILFLFRTLLIEKTGANIRNEIAHGLVSETTANSGVYLYFFGAVIKLLVNSSLKCCEIKSDSEKLKRIYTPEDFKDSKEK